MHSLTKPEYMTEDLAFIIGCLVSEGCLNETPRGHYIHFCNSNIKLMNKYIQCMSNVFNIKPTYSVRDNVGKPYTINGVSGTIKKKVYYSCLGSKTLVKWFRELGLHYSVKSGPKQDSWNKVVPWSILQADFKAQRAYLAAYIEGDGSVDREGIRIHSRSMELLKQTQILIMSHGYLSRIKEARTCNTLTVLKAHAVLLFKDIQKYMISKTNINSSSFSNIGVPTDFVIRIFDERRLSRFEFKNDEGDVVKVQGFRHYFKSNGIKHISHDSLSYPIVQKVLDHLKIISKSTYDKLIDLLDQSYYFSKVSDIQCSDKKIDVYDLSIDNRYDPSFTANGMIVHNCVIMYQLKSTLEVNKDQRYDIKAITFGRIYGKISISYAKPKSEGGLGKTEEECEQITTNFDNTFKIGTDWLGEQHEKGKAIIGVESPLGMFRHLDGYLHTRPAIINAMNRRGPNSMIQGTSSHVGVTAIRSIQKVFWHFWVKHDIPICYDVVTNYVHDAIESHCPISFLPVYLYIKYHAMTTLVHRRFNKVFGYNFRVGLEAEGIIGGALSECKEEYAWNFDWPSLEESIDKTLKFHQETLGYEYSKKEIRGMKADAEHNWNIVSQLRLKELKESVKSPKANTLMLMNEENSRSLGLRIEGMDGVVRTVG